MALAATPESQLSADSSTDDLMSGHALAASPVESVAKGALALLSAQPLTWAASALAVVLVPRYLGDVAFGQATLGLTLSALAGPAVSLGLLEYLSRSLASRSKDAAREATLALFVMTTAACAIALILGIAVRLAGLDLGSPTVLIVALGTIIITPAQGLLLTVLRAQERMARFAIITSLSAAAGSLVPVGVLIAGGGLDGFAASTLIVAVVALLVSWRTSGIRLPRCRLTVPLLLGLLPAGLPFFGWTLSMQLYGQVDRLFIGFLAPVQVVGWYAAATRIVSIPIFVPLLIATPLFPALTRCRADRAVFRATVQTSLRATLLATAPFCAATAAVAPAIPRFLGWPTEFDATTAPMTILAPNLTLIAVDMVLGTALLALGRERKWMLVGVTAAVVNPSLNVLAIPFAQATWGNGGIGAAAVMVSTELLMLAGALLLMPRGVLSREVAHTALRTLGAGAAFVLLSRALLNLGAPLPIALLPGALAFTVSVLALRVVTVGELAFALRFALSRASSRRRDRA